MMPEVQAFRSQDGRTLYRVSVPNGKRMTFDADELAALGSLIHSVLRSTTHATTP